MIDIAAAAVALVIVVCLAGALFSILDTSIDDDDEWGGW